MPCCNTSPRASVLCKEQASFLLIGKSVDDKHINMQSLVTPYEQPDLKCNLPVGEQIG